VEKWCLTQPDTFFLAGKEGVRNLFPSLHEGGTGGAQKAQGGEAMKRLIVIGTLIVATLQASPAFGEVMWVLWGKDVLNPRMDSRAWQSLEWVIIDTYTSRPACESARAGLGTVVRAQPGGGYTAPPYQCLPDTVDPRPKR